MAIPISGPAVITFANTGCAATSPISKYDSGGNLKSPQKHLSPPGRSNILYVLPGTDGSLLCDNSFPIVVTEGEFKALALLRLAAHCSSTKLRFLPISVSGVYNWRGTIGKLLARMRAALKSREQFRIWTRLDGNIAAFIPYDADAVMKDVVRMARSELAAHLRSRGAVVGFLEWDVARGKGIDGHPAIVGPETVLDEIAHVDFAGLPGRRICYALNRP